VEGILGDTPSHPPTREAQPLWTLRYFQWGFPKGLRPLWGRLGGERPIFGRIERLIVGRATPVTISLMSTKPLRRNMKHHML
jgi:hypothetical protein